MREADAPKGTGRTATRRLSVLLLVAAAACAIGLAVPGEVEVADTGAPVQSLSPVFPGWGVQQDLGRPLVRPERAVVWIGAGQSGGRGEASIAIVAGPDSTVLSQVTIDIVARSRVSRHLLEFRPYDAPNDDLRLQIVVTENSKDFLVIGVSHSEEAFRQPTLNGDPLDFQGPLAYELTGRGTGFHGAIAGPGRDRVLLALMIGLAASAVATFLWGERIARLFVRTSPRAVEPRRRQIHAYPWMFALFQILSFAAGNLTSVKVAELLAWIGIALVGVTVAFLTLRLALRQVQLAATWTAIAAIAFFTFGHLQAWLDGASVDRLFVIIYVAGFAILALAARVFIDRVARATTYLNAVGVFLVLIPVVSIGASVLRPSPAVTAATVPGFELSSVPATPPADERPAPDIYLIVLDEYARHDRLGSFDNSAFLSALRARGFFIPEQAQSNYANTFFSMPSMLHMRYLTEYHDADSAEQELVTLTHENTVTKTFKALGYYVQHLSSGFTISDENRDADVVIEFTPAGPRVAGASDEVGPFAVLRRDLFGEFTFELLMTTLARPFVTRGLQLDPTARYAWWHPERARQTFQWLQRVLDNERPIFTIAHILKPHGPYNVDQFGNVAVDLRQGFSVDHDPTVPEPYHGQLLFMNDQVIQTVDAIVRQSTRPPVIILTADHGRGGGPMRHDIFSAYLFPGPAADRLYDSISLVNVFRIVFREYFGLDVELLDDLRIATAAEA